MAAKTTPGIAALLAKVKPATAAVRMCLAGDLLAERDLLRDELAQHDGWEPGDLSAADPRTALREQLSALEERMRANTAEFRFQALGEKAWSDLLAVHPAREGKDEQWDSGTFPMALLAASAVEPAMTVADVEQLFDAFNLDQRSNLFHAAYSANIRGVDIPFSSASYAAGGDTAKK